MTVNKMVDDPSKQPQRKKFLEYNGVETFVKQAIPWMADHDVEIRPVMYFVIKSLQDAGILDYTELPGLVSSHGPAILAAANDLKAASHSPRQIVLRALLAAGIPANPDRRAFIERLATHVDAIVADFGATFGDWATASADQNALMNDRLVQYAYIIRRGGFDAITSQEWGMNWWYLLLVDGSGGGSFAPTWTLEHAFVVKWQRVLGLRESQLGTLDWEVDSGHVHWLLSTYMGTLPAMRDVLHPRLRGELDSPEAFVAAMDVDNAALKAEKESKAALIAMKESQVKKKNFTREDFLAMREPPRVRLEEIQAIEWAPRSNLCRLGRFCYIIQGFAIEKFFPHAGQHLPECEVRIPSFHDVKGVLARVAPHVDALADDLMRLGDPSRCSDEQFVQWLRERSMLLDFEALHGDHDLIELPLPDPLPRDIRKHLNDTMLHGLAGLTGAFTELRTLSDVEWFNDPSAWADILPRPAGSPVTQEELAWVLAWVLNDLYINSLIDDFMECWTGIGYARVIIALAVDWRERLGIPATFRFYSTTLDRELVVDPRRPGLGLRHHLAVGREIAELSYRGRYKDVVAAEWSDTPFVPVPGDLDVPGDSLFCMVKLARAHLSATIYIIVKPDMSLLVNWHPPPRLLREGIVHENGTRKNVQFWKLDGFQAIANAAEAAKAAEAEEATGPLEAGPEVWDPFRGQVLPQWWDPADIVNGDGTPRYTPPHPGAMLATFLDDLPLGFPLYAWRIKR